ncbi:MAG: GNAT family N-acetyltransferase [Bacteroidales bacterium]|nr:GNAT family N-acetyltransferase [Bacteroidales bacterium]
MWHFSIDTEMSTIHSTEYREWWQQLWDHATTKQPFAHPDMVLAWIDAYSHLQHISPCFIRATEDNGSEALLPLVRWRRNIKNAHLRMLIPAGYSDYDYHTPLIAGNSEGLIDALSDQLHSIKVDRIELPGLDSPLPHCTTTNESCYEIKLEQYNSFDTYLQTHYPAAIAIRHRKENKLRHLGIEGFHLFATNEVDVAVAQLPSMLQHYHKRHPHAYIAPGFHEHLLRQVLPTGLLHFSMLTVNNRPVSWNLYLHMENNLLQYLHATDATFSQYSVGTLHLIRNIEWAFNNGMQRFDFMRGNETYKQSWATGQHTLYNNVYVCRQTLSAKLRNSLYNLRKHIAY